MVKYVMEFIEDYFLTLGIKAYPVWEFLCFVIKK